MGKGEWVSVKEFCVCTIKAYKAVAYSLVLQKTNGLLSFSSQASRVSISAYHHSWCWKVTAEGRRNSGADDTCSEIFREQGIFCKLETEWKELKRTWTVWRWTVVQTKLNQILSLLTLYCQWCWNISYVIILFWEHEHVHEKPNCLHSAFFSVTKNNKNYFKRKSLTTERFIESVIPCRCET